MSAKNRLRRLATTSVGALLMATGLAVAAPGVAQAEGGDPSAAAITRPNCYASDTHCQIGIQTSAFRDNYCTTESAHILKVCIKFEGDLVYVQDNESDGKSAVADIQRSDGGGIRRICRNSSGYGTWVVCNFDWSEEESWRIYGWTFDQWGGVTWDGDWRYINSDFDEWIGQFYD